MIFNYLLTHYAIESNNHDKLSLSIPQLLDNVIYQNLVLISDQNYHVWRKLKDYLKHIYKNSDSNLKKIETKMAELRKSNKIYNINIIYNEKEVKEFINLVTDEKIEIDGIIVNETNKKSFDKTIVLENYSLQNIEEKRINFFYNGLSDIDETNREFLKEQLKKISWNSARLTYYDYNISGTPDNLRQGWAHGFKLLAEAFSLRHNKIKGKPVIDIYTPLYCLKMNYLNTSQQIKIKSIQDNIKRYVEIDNDVFQPIHELVDINFYFYDPKDHTFPSKGKKGHNRYIQSDSTLIDVEDGFDIFDKTGKIIKFADWTFALKNRLSLEQIRKLPKYNFEILTNILKNC